MIIYLIRHSGPFVEFENAQDLTWDEFNANMTLSVEGEENAKQLCLVKELKNIKNIYSSPSGRAIATAKYIAKQNNSKIALDRRLTERSFGIKSLKEFNLGIGILKLKTAKV